MKYQSEVMQNHVVANKKFMNNFFEFMKEETSVLKSVSVIVIQRLFPLLLLKKEIAWKKKKNCSKRYPQKEM